MTFSILQPPRILFGRGEAAKAPALVRAFGDRVLVVHGKSPARAKALIAGLEALGADVQSLSCATEPTLADLEAALAKAKPFAPQVVVAIGGGAVIDLGKALAAMLPAPGGVMDHLEVVGKALPLVAEPLPFVALPTTAGTGAEVTKNAVIGLPATLPNGGRKVSLRDDRMIARIAIVDPALTDGCPWDVTLASGLDAVTQVIEPYVSAKATPYTDAITRPVIASGMQALLTLAQGEDKVARDALAWTSLCGGLALANAGLGAVHGFAGVIGGMTGAAHGAICGALLGPVLEMNRQRTTGPARAKLDEVCTLLAGVLDCDAAVAPQVLADWARTAGLPGLTTQGLDPRDHKGVAEAAILASSMRGNPVPLAMPDLMTVLERASG